MQQDQFKELRSEFRRRKDAGETIMMRNGEIIQATRRASFLDLDTLVSNAEEEAQSTEGNEQAEISTQPQTSQGDIEGQQSNEEPDAEHEEITGAATEQESAEDAEK